MINKITIEFDSINKHTANSFFDIIKNHRDLLKDSVKKSSSSIVF